MIINSIPFSLSKYSSLNNKLMVKLNGHPTHAARPPGLFLTMFTFNYNSQPDLESGD